MLEEAADELHDIEREDSRSLAVGFAVANQRGAVLYSHDARITDGDLEDVGSEVFESGLTRGDRLGVIFQLICQTSLEFLFRIGIQIHCYQNS